MSDITRLLEAGSRGLPSGVDLTSNRIVVGSIEVGGGSGTTLTKTILDNLVNLQNGTDFSNGTNSHTHDGRYYTETELGSSSSSSGSDLIGDDNTYSNFTPAAATVKGALSGIDAALATASGSTFADNMFRIYDDGDNTKNIAFQASGIATATTRTITMPDSNVDLGKVATAIQKDGSVTFTANQPMGTHKLTGLSAGTTAGDSVRYEQAILIDGSNAFTANQPMGTHKLTGLSAGTTAGDSVRYEQAILTSGANAFGADQSLGGFKLTNVADPVSAQDAATKSYVDASLLGLKPKNSVRAATTTSGTLASSFANGSVIDGVTLATGDRILIKDQSSSAQNGIYTVNASGSPTRSTDADSASELNGAWTAVQEGTANAGKVFVQYGVITTLDTDPVTFTYFNPIAALIGGDMITFSGSTFSVDLATASGLESTNPGDNAGQLRIKLEASNPSLKFTGSNELAVKLNAAGAITSGASGLIVGVDGSTIEISSNALRVKDAGITLAKLASNSVDENKIVSTTFSSTGGLTGGSGTKVSVNTDGSTIELNSNALRVKDAGITAAKLASGVFDQTTITGGTGSAAAVQYAPQVKKTMVAGESFAANTSFLVRLGINSLSETTDRVYKADKDASSTDKFWVIGIALSTGSVSAGGNIDVTIIGTHTQGSSDSAFSSGDIGKALFLSSSGAWTTTPPSATNDAAIVVGIVESTTKVWVQRGSVLVN